MKIKIIRVSRLPQWPLWAVMLVLVWLAMGNVLVFLSAHFNQSLQLCIFKRLTGIACPTCGFTRGALYLLRGQIGQAWLCNPMLYSILFLFFAVTTSRIISGWAIKIRLTNIEYKVVWLLTLALLVVNWTYIILYVG